MLVRTASAGLPLYVWPLSEMGRARRCGCGNRWQAMPRSRARTAARRTRCRCVALAHEMDGRVGCRPGGGVSGSPSRRGGPIEPGRPPPGPGPGDELSVPSRSPSPPAPVLDRLEYSLELLEADPRTGPDRCRHATSPRRLIVASFVLPGAGRLLDGVRLRPGRRRCRQLRMLRRSCPQGSCRQRPHRSPGGSPWRPRLHPGDVRGPPSSANGRSRSEILEQSGHHAGVENTPPRSERLPGCREDLSSSGRAQVLRPRVTGACPPGSDRRRCRHPRASGACPAPGAS